MGNGLRIGGIALGGLALFWSLLLFGIYSLLAVAGGSTILFIAPLVGFGAGALSIAGGILGVKRAALGAIFVLAAGSAGLLGAAVPLLLGPPVEAAFTEFLVVYLANGWWAILMVLVGGITLLAIWRTEGLPSSP
ncbi:MAG: hypothetical protein ACE5I4_01760 [Thermoplasmata archaeon]